MPEWFDVAKDDQGTIALKVPPREESYVAEQMRRSDYQGVTVYTGLVILQLGWRRWKLSAVTARLVVWRAGPRPPSSKLREPRSNAWGVWIGACLAGGPTHATTRSSARPGRANHWPGPTVGRNGPESPGNLPEVGSAGPGAAGQEVEKRP